MLFFSVEAPTHKHSSLSALAILFALKPASLLLLLVLRTLVGHKANICSLDFHPYGEFVASGSQDTNIKVRCPSALCLRWLAAGRHVLPEGWVFSSLWGCLLCAATFTPS